MNKNQFLADFLADQDVKDFISWLITNLPNIKICFRIGKSRFVPTPINVQVNGFGGVIDHYKWKSTGMATGDWAEAKKHLTSLSNNLRTAVASGNDANTFAECLNILSWGGNRSKSVGAYPFLSGKTNTSALCNYIRNTGRAFLLATANEANLSPPVEQMNAMLTKVHALYADDGLPIYDSRVAAAIATLVEFWRQSQSKTGEPIPAPLAFPATLTSRTVFRRFPTASHHPGVMSYGASATPAKWSSAKVRLGWIMEQVLNQNAELFSSQPNRMHAFEASLFMVGYDTACLNPCPAAGAPVPSGTAVNPVYAKAIRKVRTELVAPFRSMTKTTCKTLVQKCAFEYSGNPDEGYVIWYTSGAVLIEPEFIIEMQNIFGGGSPVPFGFNMTGAPAGSFGHWISQQSSQFGRTLSPRHASHIAALLVQEGFAQTDGRQILFP